MKIKPAVGRVVVRELAQQTKTAEGYLLPAAEKNKWGEILAIGAPQPDIFSPWQLLKFRLLGIHPCPYKKGARVLLPSVGGRTFDTSDGPVYVFWQSDIEVYEN